MATKTRVAICLDKSGSMYGIEKDMFLAAGNIIKQFREKVKSGHQVDVSVITFSNNVHVNLWPTDARNLTDAAINQLFSEVHISGSTALFDATMKGLEVLDKTVDDEVSFLLLVYTDGGENASSTSAAALQKKFRELEKTDKYTLTFQVPFGGKSVLTSFGISPDNIREWEQTQKGVQEVEAVSTKAIDTYFTARSAGARSVKNFYQHVVVDANKVTDKDLNKLDDLSKYFHMYKVDKENTIKDYVEAKTKKPYVMGQAFYELTKPEKIQSNKDLLLLKKGDSEIYGGKKVRNLLNLPTDGSDAKVEPGNFGQYRIFVRSTSSNRKLVRGTALLVDPKMMKGLKPTWEDLTKA